MAILSVVSIQHRNWFAFSGVHVDCLPASCLVQQNRDEIVCEVQRDNHVFDCGVIRRIPQGTEETPLFVGFGATIPHSAHLDIPGHIAVDTLLAEWFEHGDTLEIACTDEQLQAQIKVCAASITSD